jgi:hypothetical protein
MPTVSYNPIDYASVNESYVTITNAFKDFVARINELDTSCLSYQPITIEDKRQDKKQKEILYLQDEFESFTFFLEHRVN